MRNSIKKDLEQKFGVILPENISWQRISEEKTKEWLERGDRVTYLWPQDLLTTQETKAPFILNTEHYSIGN